MVNAYIGELFWI